MSPTTPTLRTSTVCLLLLVSVHTCRDVARGDDIAPSASSYFYDAAGRRDVIVSQDEFLVRVAPAPGRDPGLRPSTLPPREVPDTLAPAAARLEDQLRHRGLHVVRHAAAAALHSNADVVWALPVVYPVGSQVPMYMTDEIIAAFRPEVDERQIADVAAAHGCDVRKCPRGVNRYVFRVLDTRSASPLVVANALHERRDLTLYAHPDFFLPKLTQSPPTIQDPYYLSHQWHLDGDVAKGAQAGSDINVEAAWDTDHGADAQGVPSVRVAILDECVEKLHPDLFPNWAAGLDLDPVPPDDDPSPDAGQKHGTSCAGVAVAAGNTIGVRGAAPNCGLIGVKFFGATVSEMAEGFYFCVDPNDDGDHSDGAAVLSNSWSFADGTSQPADVVNAVNYAANSGRNGRGCLVLFAAANDDHTVNGVTAIAQLPTVMAVGGTNSNAQHTEFSDVGPELAIATPTNDRGDDGVRFSWLNITTVDNTGTSGYNGLPDLDYTNAFGGTSSATPLAAGVLALIISQDPNMTAAQARAILQHTAVRLDEPYGRFDGITGHSHRYGFGKADAGAAIAAADAGLRWPDRIRTLTATGAGNDISLIWQAPLNDYVASLLVRSDKPFAWMPTDGMTYSVGQVVVPGVQVIYNAALSAHTDVGATNGAFFYAVYPRSGANLYGYGAKTHMFRNTTNLLWDNSEGADPGWTHGGLLDEWTRGTPTSSVSAFSQSVSGSGPLAGLNGTRAIGGNKCWGTDLNYTYDAGTDSYLQTPLINLTGVSAPVFLEYYDWCLLETFYDTCSVEVVNAAGGFIGYLDADTGGDYDWTRRVYDLTPFAGQPIRVRFRITSDGLFQRDGWFIDDVRIVAATSGPLPPVALDVYAETTTGTPVSILLRASDPNAGTTLDYVIASLPQHGQLSDPNGGTINAVPYTLAAHGYVVTFTPAPAYQGPDSFNYHATDDALNSNQAVARLSVGTATPAYVYNLDSNPGWITEGSWAYGRPLGSGGDPSAGYTGLNVYGYNLAGQYSNNMPARYLTMLPINCTGLSRVTLSFARWLGVEAGSYDKATVEASSDGANWTTVWRYDGTTNLQETSWSQQSYNISTVADNQPFVLIRWGMGPTDGGDTFAGWNIDDVTISAIGTPPTNQPPYAADVAASTALDTPADVTLDATDPNSDPLQYIILSLPAHGTLSDPNGGVIASVPYTLLAGGDMVRYQPAPAFSGIDTFDYRAQDAELSSNLATASVEVLLPAPFPFAEDFEAGPPLADYWTTHSTATGRILITGGNGPVGNYHMTMDSTADGTYALNEATLVADLQGHSMVILQYDWKDFGDETHQLPAMWYGSAEGDGVAISVDGLQWFRIANLFDTALRGADGDDGDAPAGPRADEYQTVRIDLDQAASAAGLSYTRTFRIRFQQYDNNPIASDGVALDNVQLVQGTDDPLIATDTLPTARLNEPYGPVDLEVIGGDTPFTWSTLLLYDEQDLGASQFAEVGTPMGWQGDDLVYDYTLPFAFPFYGESLGAVKIGTDGWINFAPHVGSTYNNSTVLLTYNKRIAVLWDDLRTDRGGDIYIDTTVPGQATIRWNAVTRAGEHPCNFSATLFENGRIQLHYGNGNTGLTPTIGLSKGDQTHYMLASYNGMTALTNADSLEFQALRLPNGIQLSTAGVLSGVPTELGAFQPVFHVQDAQARTDTKQVPLTVTDEMFGDFDGDRDVDDNDFTQFRVCYTGPDGGPVGPQCQAGDDDDNDIDCDDWQAFRTAFYNSSGYQPLMSLEAFVAALVDPQAEELDRCLADITADGSANGADVQPYVDALLGQ